MTKLINVKIKFFDNNSFVLFQKIAFFEGFDWEHSNKKTSIISFFSLEKCQRKQVGVLISEDKLTLTSCFNHNSSFKKSDYMEISSNDYINNNGLKFKNSRVVEI